MSMEQARGEDFADIMELLRGALMQARMTPGRRM
jgi:hypothetical protein